MPINVNAMTEQQQITAIYVAYYDRAPDPAGLQYWVDQLQGGRSLAQIASDFSEAAETKAKYPYFDTPDVASADTFITGIYTNLFGRTPDDAGREFWTDQLESGSTPVGEIILAILEGAQSAADGGDPDEATVNNKIEVGLDWAQSAIEAGIGLSSNPIAEEVDGKVVVNNNAAFDSATGVLDNVDGTADSVTDAKAETDTFVAGGGGVSGDTFMLTTGADNLTGTADNNTFTAEVQQNSEGASTNALSTGDVIDGGEGVDKLEATLVNDNQTQNGENLTVNPRTENLEQVYITGMDENVTLDAGRMDSVEQFWSDDSDENVIIEDVRLGSNLNITKDITFGMRDVDTDSGLSASFDTQSLVKAGNSTSNSQIIVEVGDSNKAADTTTPVERIELELNFTFGGEEYSFESISSEDGTYQGLATAIESALSAQGLDGLDVTLGESFDSITAANDEVSLAYDSGQQVVITDPEGGEFTDFTSGVGATAGEASSNPVSDVRVVDPIETSNVIETNLVLDNAGRGSTAGDAIIGGMSNSDQTIEKLNLVVDRDSKIDDLATASNMEDNAFDDADYEGFNEIELTSGDAEGDLSIQDIQDTTTFDASAFAGESLTINEASALQTLSANVDADVDVTSSTAAGENVYTTGAGDDTLTTTVDGDDVDTVGESFAMTTNGGDDTVVVQMTEGVSYNTMEELDNLSISTGAGDDTVNLDAYGTFDISTGDGSDFVRINSVGENGNATTGSWTIGDGTGAQSFDERVLYEAKVTVSFAGIEETVTVETDRDGNFIATQTDINTAVKAAIDGNHELSDLLDYEDGTGDQSLTITSNVGGLNNLGIAIYQPQLVAAATDGVEAGQDVTLAAGDVDAIREGLISTGVHNSADSDDTTVANIVDATDDDNFFGSLNTQGVGDDVLQSTADIEGDVTEGVNVADVDAGGIFQDATNLYFDLQAGNSTNSNDGSVNLSSVNVGDGSNDIVSVHSGTASSNKLVIDQSFGKVTVVNWHDVSPDQVTASDDQGQHALDFSAYLADEVDASDNNNDDSKTDVNTTVNMVTGAAAFGADLSAGVVSSNDAEANSVNIIRFAQDFADDETFSGLDASTLLDALNDDGDYGNLDNALLNPGTTANLVGDTQNHIVMVENDLNEGEYKVFHLTSESAADDFSTAVELGTLDFGASINVNVVGSTNYENYTAALEDALDAAENVFTNVSTDSDGNETLATIIDKSDDTGEIGVDIDGFTNANDGDDIEFSLSDDGLTVDLSGGDVTQNAEEANFTIKGGAGDDNITGGNGDDTIDGGAGADQITAGAGDDEFVFNAGDEGDTITDFTVGDDLFDIDNTDGQLVEDGAADGTVDIDGVNIVNTAADITVADGLQIIDNGDADIANADSLSLADIADRLNDTGDDNNGDGNDNIISFANANDQILFAISDGTDTVIVNADANGGDTVIDEGELTVLVTLTGVSDAGTLTAANFDGFA